MYWVGKNVSSLFLKKFKGRFHAGLIYKPWRLDNVVLDILLNNYLSSIIFQVVS